MAAGSTKHVLCDYIPPGRPLVVAFVVGEMVKINREKEVVDAAATLCAGRRFLTASSAASILPDALADQGKAFAGLSFSTREKEESDSGAC